MRRLIALLLVVLSLAPLFPEEVEETESFWSDMTFFSGIVSVSYLSDFAYKMFPVSAGVEYGIKGLEFLENRTTRLLLTMNTGMTQRTLRQDPVTGALIDSPGADEKYSVVFSDNKIGIQQGLIDNPRPKQADYLTLYVNLGMRWEQAFSSFKDIQSGDYSGVFGNELYFPYGQAEYSGTPDLSYGLYSLSAYINLKFTFRDRDNDYLAPGGYSFTIDFLLAPWWLLNTGVFTDTKVDFYRVRYSASYSYTIAQAKWASGFNIYSIVFDFSLDSQFLVGQSVPRYAYVLKFRDMEIPPRTFITDIKATLTVNGPEILGYGTYPELNIFLENALSSGDLLNTEGTRDMKFYGSVGAKLTIHILNMFEAYVGAYYDYLPMEGYTGGFDWDWGCYFVYIF